FPAYFFCIFPPSSSEPSHLYDSFLIYNEKLRLCVQLEGSDSIILDRCNKDNEQQHFKWVSDDQMLNMAVKLCLAVSSKADLVPVTLSPCNRTSALQKWECSNDTLLALKEDLFLHPANAHKGKVVLSKISTMKSTWKIYGTGDSLCSQGYEALFTLNGNGFGAPCIFPFKYMNQWHAKCISEGDENGRLWCGTTADVEKDALTGYCPVKGGHDDFFWTRNHWTGDLYQINTQSALTWYQARKSCQQQDAELLSITELHEQIFLAGLTGSINNDYWTGLNNLDFDSGWQWIDNCPLRYLNWAPGSPSLESEKICGSMESNSGKWENKNCEEKLGYICKKGNSSSDASGTPSDDSKPVKCPDGWSGYAGHCYHLNRDPKTWKAALLSCRKDGGDLLSIHHIEEYSFVISQLSYRPTDVLWIGLNDRKTQMYFEWSDGAPVRFTKWQRGEPTHISDVQEDCVTMSGENGYWSDYFCEEELGYICKREPLATVAGETEMTDPYCPEGWKRYSFYCYYIGQTAVIFSEAKSFCEANGGSLTSVDDRYEQAFLTSLTGLHSEKMFWIGLSDIEQPGTFKWTNRSDVLFTHWNSEMPGRQPGCVAMRTGTAAGLWDVVSCEEKAPFLCKQWAAGVTPPPIPTTKSPPTCPEGWSLSPTGRVCFKVGRELKKTWFEAQDFCRELGGDLASIHIYDEVRLIYEDSWIGINPMGPNTGFTWSDGSPVNVSLKPEPINTLGMLDAFMWKQNVMVYVTCSRKTECVVSLSSFAEHSFKIIEDGWIEYENNEYYFSNTTLHAEGARRFCRAHNADLTVIESERERRFLRKYSVFYGSSMNDPYIGLILGLDKKFGWMDGSPVTYVAWAPDEPNFKNDDEHCVVMYLKTGFWNGINCGALRSFICERHNSSVRSTVAPTSAVPLGGCAEGWLWFNNKCFKIFGFNEKERKNWYDARTDCRKHRGNLVNIPSESVQAFLTVHLKSTLDDTWIGLNDVNWPGRFLWTDGTVGVYYTNWAKVSSYYSIQEKGYCVFMMSRPERLAGNWRDDKCDGNKSYICQRNTDPALPHHETTIPASGYVPYGNSSYSLASPKMTWEEARRKCRSEGAELASVLTPYVQSFLWLQVLKYGEPVWIGLNSNMTNERYKWISRWRLVYTNWAPDEPKQKIACVYLDLDGHWKTGNCNEKYFSVCEQSHGIVSTEIPDAPGRCPELKETELSWIPFRTHCYAIHPGNEYWSAASKRCSQLGSTLTSIEDLAEQEFLREHTEQLRPMDFWLGLVKSIDGEWIWQDNTAVDFVNWKEGYLDDHSVFMNGHTGEWSISREYYSKGFICKRKKSNSMFYSNKLYSRKGNAILT
uniref:Mannose receptor, C type 1b n=1 Tax=Varanus komodoensis TaxID=61221 RepID=A0A8D2J1X2_VARKO